MIDPRKLSIAIRTKTIYVKKLDLISLAALTKKGFKVIYV